MNVGATRGIGNSLEPTVVKMYRIGLMRMVNKTYCLYAKGMNTAKVASHTAKLAVYDALQSMTA